jgi:predicted SnoaL-like aldol condensation-catalyzing enzyme
MKFRHLALAAIPAALLLSGVAFAEPRPSTAIAAVKSDSKLEAKNKQIVLDMWYTILNERKLDQASKYIVADYIQHNPNAGQGLAAMVDYFKKAWGPNPPSQDQVKYTQFAMVIAEGDLVQLMFKRPRPDPKDPAKTVDTWWYDTYRLKDGMIVEHWDSALPSP